MGDGPDFVTVVLHADGFPQLLETLTSSSAWSAPTRTCWTSCATRAPTPAASSVVLTGWPPRSSARRPRRARAARRAGRASPPACASAATRSPRPTRRGWRRCRARAPAAAAPSTRSRRLLAARARAAAAAGPGGPWAIPWPIVQCESGGQNLPPNFAGASGYYQILDSTWKGLGGSTPHAYQASKAEQDRLAARLWAGGAGRAQLGLRRASCDARPGTSAKRSRPVLRSAKTCRRGDHCSAWSQTWSFGGAGLTRLALMPRTRLLTIALVAASLTAPAVAAAQETPQEYTDSVCAPRSGGEQCGRATGARRRAAGTREGLPQGLAEDHRHPVEGPRQRRHHRNGAPRTTTSCSAITATTRSIGGAGKDVLWGDWEPEGQRVRPVRHPARRRRQRLPLSQPRQEQHVRRARATTASSPTTGTARSTAGRARATTPRRAGRATPTRSATASASGTSARSAQSPTATARSPARRPRGPQRQASQSALLSFLVAW